LVNISKRKSVAALGDISVSQIDDGGEEIEEWSLKQAFVTKIEWGSYKYDGDDLDVLKLTVKYDWAECTISRPTLSEAVSPTTATSTTTTSPFFSKIGSKIVLA